MFIIHWVFDKLGYMPKIDMQVGKVQIDTQAPDFKMWPFPIEEPKPKKPVAKKKVAAKKPAAKKTTTRKPKAK
jgi:hypothetical protein